MSVCEEDHVTILDKDVTLIMLLTDMAVFRVFSRFFLITQLIKVETNKFYVNKIANVSFRILKTGPNEFWPEEKL